MRLISEFLGLTTPLAGLEDILEQVANGELAQDDAARQIRSIASRPRLPPGFPRLFRIAGVIFAIVGIGFTAYSIAFSIGSKEAQGTVIELVGGHMTSPVVEYHVDGKRLTMRSPVSSSPPAYFVGEKVSVFYRPETPTRAQINSFTDRWSAAVIITCVGISMVVASYFIATIFNYRAGAE